MEGPERVLEARTGGSSGGRVERERLSIED